MTEAASDAVPVRAGRRAARVVVLSVVVLASAVGLWIASPRSSEIQLQPPAVCSYPRRGFDRVTIVTCGGPDAVGVLNREQVLVPTGDRTRSGRRATIPHATVLGRLHITKPWFGPYHYEFVAEDGTVTELTEVNRYIGAVEETL